MSKKSNRTAKALAEIEGYKANRRKDIIKMGGAITLMLVLIWLKAMLEVNGVLQMGNAIAGGALALVAFLLAVFAGSAGVDFAKNGRTIQNVRDRAGLGKSNR